MKSALEEYMQQEIDRLKEENRALSDSLDSLAGHPPRLTAEEQLEWLWANCRIVYQDVVENYPIEHCQWAKKDSRAFIEAQMPNANVQPDAAEQG